MLRNLLVNTTLSTGIYNQYRVWSVAVSVSLTPGNAADSLFPAMAPLAQTTTAYSSLEALSSAPNSMRGTSTFGGSGASCTMSAHWGIPALLGVPNNLFPASPYAIGSFSVDPILNVTCQAAWRNDNNTNNTANLGVKVIVAYHVEFFNRADSGLAN